MMCLWVCYEKRNEKKKIFFTSLKLLKKGVRSGVGSGSASASISQMYRSGSAPKCRGSPTLVIVQPQELDMTKKYNLIRMYHKLEVKQKQDTTKFHAPITPLPP
jgi:hypothetical protein